MKMNALNKFIIHENNWNTLFGAPAITMPSTPEERDALIDRVEGMLSPENLWCDGEASPAHVRKESKRLNAVMDDLNNCIVG